MLSSTMLFLKLLALIWLVAFASGQAILPSDEVESLQVIGRTLGKRDWNFSVDPCSGSSGWVTQNNPFDGFENNVTCNCTFQNSTVCHIVSIILKGQNLSGSLPRELPRLSFLQEIELTRNYLNGTILREWGSMNLVKIALLGNRITGSIPIELANISTLVGLTLDINRLSGTIPPELGNLPGIEKLSFISNNLTGELPENLARLTTLRDFRISDNNFRGSIPNFIQNWTNIDKFYLTGNKLTGSLPSWMLEYGDNIDLSYNNLTSQNPPLNCQPRRLNLFASSKGNTSDIAFEEDANSGGPSSFSPGRPNWGFSSTGHFLDDSNRDSLITSNRSIISGLNSQLYMDARISPLSLSYYAFCMINGNYTVSLHFAEIMFTDDTTYSSLGRRIFDVYIQEKQVLKDFNIEEEAGGVNRGIIRNFTATVTDNTLDIRFYWAGKGTNAIPSRGVYGPLISAISVDPDFTPLNENNISVGAIVGIVVGVVLAILLVLAFLWWMCWPRRERTLEDDLKGVDLSFHKQLRPCQ